FRHRDGVALSRPHPSWRPVPCAVLTHPVLSATTRSTPFFVELLLHPTRSVDLDIGTLDQRLILLELIADLGAERIRGLRQRTTLCRQSFTHGRVGRRLGDRIVQTRHDVGRRACRCENAYPK